MSPLAVVGVLAAPGCPDSGALVAALSEQIQTFGREAAAEGAGEYGLSVAQRGEGVVRLRLRDGRGTAIVDRDVEVAGVSCAFRARTIAGIVERYLAGLSTPPEGMSAPPPLEVLVRPTRVHRVDLRVGPEGAVAVDGDGTTFGLAVGIAARPLRRLVLSLDAFVLLDREIPSGLGSITLAHDGLRFAAAYLVETSFVRLDLGPAARIDRMEGSASRVPSGTSAEHATLALGVRVVAIRRFVSRLYTFLAVEPYRALAISRFAVLGGDEVRTPGWGVGISLGVGYAFFRL